MKERCITIGKMFGILFVSTIFGALLLTFAYSLPTDKIIYHVNNSLDIYKHELDATHWAGGSMGYSSIHTNLDNFTDSIMLMKAMYPVDENAFVAMMQNFKVEDNAFMAMLLNPSWPLVAESPIHTLIFAKEDPLQIDSNNTWTYPLYWHGYLTILKPALMFATVQDLRVINLYIQMILIATALMLIYKKIGLREMYAFLLVIAVINPVTTAMNFQNSDIFYIMLFATIFILWKNESLLRGKNYLYLFLIIGIITVYFDFLTYPIVSFGIPLCVCVLMNREFFFYGTIKKIFMTLSAYSFAWGFGYGGMWIGKWLVAYKIGDDPNVFNSALNQAVYRSSTSLSLEEGGHSFTIMDVFERNFIMVMNDPLQIIFVLLLFLLLWLIIIHRDKFSHTIAMLLTFMFIMALPFLWYVVMKNHSYVHDFLTYRDLTIAIFGLMCFFIESFKGATDNGK